MTRHGDLAASGTPCQSAMKVGDRVRVGEGISKLKTGVEAVIVQGPITVSMVSGVHVVRADDGEEEHVHGSRLTPGRTMKRPDVMTESENRPAGPASAGLPPDDSERFRREVIGWLQSVDDDGIFADEDCACEGLAPLTIAAAVEIAAEMARAIGAGDMNRGADWPPAHLGQTRPLCWQSAYPERYLRFWEAVQATLREWVEAGMPEEWPPAADEYVVAEKSKPMM